MDEENWWVPDFPFPMVLHEFYAQYPHGTYLTIFYNLLQFFVIACVIVCLSH